MAEFKTAIMVTASLSAPVSMVTLAPLVLDQPLANGDPVAAVIEQHENRTLSNLGIAGRNLFQTMCTDCHGHGADGTERGPNLTAAEYHRQSYGKKSFHAAVKAGLVRQPGALRVSHQFPKLSFNELERLERYVRELQTPFNYR